MGHTIQKVGKGISSRVSAKYMCRFYMMVAVPRMLYVADISNSSEQA